jgi:murein L,D-transpeptidase YcbB/YkuD
MRKVFPSYTSKLALGPYFGKNLEKSVNEFKLRTGLKTDGRIDEKMLNKLKEYGFKY